ncbi:MAG: flagellar hook-basal body complex protein FliE [Leptospirales bacterium]|nr:flagellar hook-basal body complex protein FliE [Leptospirales bacterium]
MEIYSTRGVGFPNGQPRLWHNEGREPIAGRANIPMHVSNDRHMTPGTRPADSERVTEGFAAALGEALRRVEDLSVRSDELTRRSIYEPDSVDVHEVMLAFQKSAFALNLTKSLADGFVRTFRDLTNPR